MEFAQACGGLGVRPITGAELTVSTPRRRRSPPASRQLPAGLLPPHAAGREPRRLPQPLPAAHRGAPAARAKGRDARPPPPAVALDASSSGAREGLVCLSGCARDGALAGRWERGDARAAPRRSGGGWWRPSGASASGSSCSGRYWRRDRARNRWLAELAERLGVRCVATGQRPLARPLAGRAPGRARRRAAARDARRVRAAAARQRGRGARAAAAMAARFADHPRRRRRERRAGRAAASSTSRATSATATRAPRTRRRPHAGRDLPRAARAPLRGDRRAPRGRAAARRRAAR